MEGLYKPPLRDARRAVAGRVSVGRGSLRAVNALTALRASKDLEGLRGAKG